MKLFSIHSPKYPCLLIGPYSQLCTLTSSQQNTQYLSYYPLQISISFYTSISGCASPLSLCIYLCLCLTLFTLQESPHVAAHSKIHNPPSFSSQVLGYSWVSSHLATSVYFQAHDDLLFISLQRTGQFQNNSISVSYRTLPTVWICIHTPKYQLSHRTLPSITHIALR